MVDLLKKIFPETLADSHLYLIRQIKITRPYVTIRNTGKETLSCWLSGLMNHYGPFNTEGENKDRRPATYSVWDVNYVCSATLKLEGT